MSTDAVESASSVGATDPPARLGTKIPAESSRTDHTANRRRMRSDDPAESRGVLSPDMSQPYSCTAASARGSLTAAFDLDLKLVHLTEEKPIHTTNVRMRFGRSLSSHFRIGANGPAEASARCPRGRQGPVPGDATTTLRRSPRLVLQGWERRSSPGQQSTAVTSPPPKSDPGSTVTWIWTMLESPRALTGRTPGGAQWPPPWVWWAQRDSNP